MIQLIYIESGNQHFEYYADHEDNMAVERAKLLTEIAEYILLTDDKGYTMYEYSRN